MDIRKIFGTNQQAEQDGVWVDFGNGVRFKVARKTSSAYAEKLQKTLRPYRGAMQAGALDNKAAHALLAKAAAGTLVLDWKGVEADGKPIAYSVDECERLLIDLPDLYKAIDSFAEDANLFRQQAEDAEAKN